MKRLINKMLLVSILFIGIGSMSCTTTRVSAVAATPSGDVNFQVFYNALSPYGEWVTYPQYGYVWVPNIADFSPYATGGHWVYSSYGWTWVSDYSWGWAPFHYGRWLYDDMYGWLWVPGNEWGPAWVAWREANGYYGWTPLGPGLNISVSFGYNIPASRWIFLPARYMGNRGMNRYYAPRERNVTIINNSTIINNVYVNNTNHARYFSGPRTDNVQRYTGHNVRTVSFEETNQPGRTVVNNNKVRIFRPAVQQSDNNHVAPSNVYTLHDIKPVDERKPNTSVVNSNAKPQRIFNNNANTNSSSPSGNVNAPAGRNSNVHFNNEYNNAPENNNISQPNKPVQPVRTFNNNNSNNHITPPVNNNNRQPENVNHPQENINRNPAPANNTNQPREEHLHTRKFSPDKPIMRKQQPSHPVNNQQPPHQVNRQPSHQVQRQPRQFTAPSHSSGQWHQDNKNERRHF